VVADYSYTNFNTNQAEKGKIPEKPRILVAPLDWGLGHATRCIPVIKELLHQGCEVWLGAEGAQERLLAQEFPSIPILTLPGYRMRYSDSAKGFTWRILSQVPKMRSAIKKEHKWLEKQIKEYEFDAVISDNRFGLYHQSIPSIFITHQLTIKSPIGKWSEEILQRWNYRHINHFNECWVPDIAHTVNNLAGDLSHPSRKPETSLHYIGLLSRLREEKIEERKGHLLVILSGPEPQRSLLENKLIDELVHYNGTADVIRGLPASDFILPSTNHIRFYNHLPAEEISKKMAEAEFVISRTGYSTVMDLIQLKKKGILIPTPGQTEQEYLAFHLQENKIVFCLQQHQFSLQTSLKKAREFSYQFPAASDNRLKETIQQFISRLKK
jgi:UDP-N-acetylglucosamine transferase subunit ALG13